MAWVILCVQLVMQHIAGSFDPIPNENSRVVRADYNGENGELSLTKGETVVVLDHTKEGTGTRPTSDSCYTVSSSFGLSLFWLFVVVIYVYMYIYIIAFKAF